MSVLKSIKNLQEYGDNSQNEYMDEAFLDIVQQKQRLNKDLTQEECRFLEQKHKSVVINS
ncbi:MAG: hypothetical protein J6N72_06200 [Psychrobacter sp.]|nr:hypothetical protein [Psychrobacter sp.]